MGRNHVEHQIRKGDLWMMIVIVVLAFLGGFCLKKYSEPGNMVVVYQNGEVLQKLPIDQDKEFEVQGAYKNKIVVKDGKVCVAQSDCPGNDCVHMGELYEFGPSIVCLPNKVEIRIESSRQEQYQETYFHVFDTVTTVTGYAGSREEFLEIADGVCKELERYHQLFDIYSDYEGVTNIKTINDKAGIAPVKVDSEIIELLLDCKEYYEATDGMVNVAMGSVLSLWHTERQNGLNHPEDAKLPEEEALLEAARHCSFDTVVIDKERSMVYLEDKEQSLDVGAIAKGWATQKVCEMAPPGLLINVGGNICVTGKKPEKNSEWIVGIQSPEGNVEDYLHIVSLNYTDDTSVVTSGDYQRYYTVGEKQYHHLIDPKTLYPSEKWKAVSIVCSDSGVGDALSTALFLQDKEEGQKLLDRYDACAVWTDSDGKNYYSDGFEKLIKK